MAHKRPKVCLIYTGGTIGMVRDHGILKAPEHPLDLERIAPEIAAIADIEFLFLMNKDSSNVTPADWTTMARTVYERLSPQAGYRGFVITHGTDTMHFSASALSFALGPNLNRPVVFTGAQTDISVIHGDARINLVRSILVALEPIAEVVISFGDRVFRGCRTQKCDERRFNAFDSPAFPPIADITESILIRSGARRVKPSRPPIEFIPDFEANVVQVALVPGLRPRLLAPLLDPALCDGVLLRAFGAGNLPDQGEYSFQSFVENAIALGIPVVIASQFPANETLNSRYQTGVAALAAGAIPTGNMTHAAATVKFHWALARVRKEIAAHEIGSAEKLARVKHLMDLPYVGEMDKSISS